VIVTGLPVVLFDMHIYTVYMYTIPLIFNAAWVHCGYELPLRFNPLLFLPMSTQSEVTHDVHHRCYRYTLPFILPIDP
jgi:sterol desaturase/sphingolipid hydroxylase (fatty acid hydroxylase superfamily)